MKKYGEPSSLKSALRKVSVKWSLIGLFLSLITGLGCILYSSKIAAESETRVLADSLSRAFRQQILQGDVRDAQFQMNSVLGGSPARSIRVLGVNRGEIYPLPGDNATSCKSLEVPCWHDLTHIEYLKPIYYDDDMHQGLYGYLSLSVKPEVSWPTVIAFGGFILLLFAIQAFGLLSALNDISRMILDPLSSWAEHISGKPNSPVVLTKSPKFTEFKKMEDAVSGLHLTITKLEVESAERAKEQAKASMISEVGHDLKTPLSQLSKNFYLLVNEVNTTKAISQSRIHAIEKSMSCMGDLIKQIKLVNAENTESQHPREITDVVQLAQDYAASASELGAHVKMNEIQVTFEADLEVAPVAIEKIKLYQIIDNLVRNAIESISSTGGKIRIGCFESDNSIVLSVSDTGLGIPLEIQGKVFDQKFTTKEITGSGLGLGIVSRICNETHAKIYFESTDGAGTEFFIEFPKVTTENQKVENLKTKNKRTQEYEA